MATLAALTLCCFAFGCNPSAPAGASQQGANGRSAAAAPGKKPNVIFILIDTLRADRLGFMGYERPTSPTMDRWAEQAVIFDRAYSPAPWTVPSIATIFSGLNPSVHHVFARLGKYGAGHEEQPGDVLSDDIETLAEAFAAGGYQTMAVVSNPFLGKEFGFAQGFQNYVFKTAEDDAAYAPATTVIAEARKLLELRTPDKPLFMYLHFMDVHAPYSASDDFREPFVSEVRRRPGDERIDFSQPIRPGFITALAGTPEKPKTPRIDPELKDRPPYWAALYDAGISELDAQFVALQALLRERKLWDDCILVLTADHGEALYEQGGWSHGMNPFDHQFHVPLMLRCPARWPKQQRIRTTTGLVNLKPTLLELAGLSSTAFSQATSIAGLIGNAEAASGDAGFAFGEGVKEHGALRIAYRGDGKIIAKVRGRGAERKEQAVYFDLSKDPLEKRRDPVPTDNPNAVELQRRLEQTLNENDRHADRFPPQFRVRTPANKQQLGGLGYLADDEGRPGSPKLPYGGFTFDPPPADSAAPAGR